MKKKQGAFSTARAPEDVWMKRTLLVKQELATASAASDAKTARLRALRMERERQEAAAPKLEVTKRVQVKTSALAGVSRRLSAP